MSGKTIFEPCCSLTQSQEAVVELLIYPGRTAELADPTSSTGKWPSSYSGLADEALQEVA